MRRPISLALLGVTFSLVASGQVSLNLRYGGGPKITITGATNATPIQITTATAHGYSAGQVVWIWGIDGNWNADGTRIVKAVQDPTHFTISYCGNSNCTVAGADAAGNGTFAAATRIGAWVGSTVAYPMVGPPNLWFDGPSGSITARVKDPDGPGALKAPRSQAGFPPYDAINTGLNIVEPNGFTMLQDCTWNGTNYAVIRGGSFAPVGAMALLWYGDNSQTVAKTCAIGWIDNVERLGETTACDETVGSCGDATNLDYTTGYFATPSAINYTLMRDQLTAAQRTNFLNQVLNDRTDGATCTAQYNTGTGTVTTATTGSGTGTMTGSGTAWLSTLAAGYVINVNNLGPKTIISVDSNTQITYRITTVSGDTGLSFSGQSYPYKWAAPWANPNCGIVFFGKHSGYSSLSPGGAYPTTGGISLSDLFGNQFETKTAQMLMYGLATANDDARGVRLAESAANQWNDTFFPLYEKFWTGPTQIDSQYGPDRFGEFTSNIVWPLYNATSGAVNYMNDRWLKDRETWNFYNLLPTSTSAAVRNVGYGVSNLAQSNWTKTADTVTMPTMTAGSNEAEYMKWFRSSVGLRGDYTAALIPLGACYGCEWAYSFSDPLDGPGTDYTSVLPTAHAFNQRNATATAACPTCGTNFLISRTGWKTSNDTVFWWNAAGQERAPNHLGQLSTGDYGPAGYFIYKGAYLLGDDIGTGKQDASGYYAQSAIRTSYFEVGGNKALPPTSTVNSTSNLRQPNGYGTTDGFASVLVSRYADGGTGPNMNEYMTALVDASNAYCATVSGTCLSSASLTRLHRVGFDFKTGQQYIVLADDNATSVGRQERLYLQYPNNGQTGEGTTTFNQGSNSVVSLTSVADSGRLNTQVLFPNSDGFTYEDNGLQTVTVTNGGSGYTSASASLSGDVGNGDAVITASVVSGAVRLTITNPGSGFHAAPTVNISGDGTGATATATISTGGSYFNNNGQTARINACIGTGTDASGCNTAATSAEIVVVHQPSSNQALTMPSMGFLSATNSFRALQIADPSTPKVACWEHGGVLQTGTSFTTTFTGTAQHICSGFAAGIYNVTVGGTPVPGSPFTVASGDNSIYWEYGPGPVSISQSGATGLLAVSPANLNFSCTVGGANPASQNVSISSSGVTLDNWSAAKTQPWLTVTPASGAAAGTAAVSADCTGLSVGPYTDTITVSSTTSGITNSPQTVGVTLTVNSTVSVSITTASIPDGAWLIPYSSFSLAATGGTAPYTYSLTAGSLPPGITASSAGVLSGLPTQAGVYSVGFVATDANGVSSPEKDFTWNVAYPLPSVAVGGNGRVGGTRK